MPDTKRIGISLPGNLLEEVDGAVAVEKRTRSEFVREAMYLYLQEIRKRKTSGELENGYMEMGELNLSLANEAFEAENEVESGKWEVRGWKLDGVFGLRQ